MPECTKAHLQQSKISKFFRGGHPDPHFQGAERKGKTREGGLGRGRGERERRGSRKGQGS